MVIAGMPSDSEQAVAMVSLPADLSIFLTVPSAGVGLGRALAHRDGQHRGRPAQSRQGQRPEQARSAVVMRVFFMMGFSRD